MCYIIAVAGGSGSGKTTFAKRLMEKFNEEDICIISQDSYYIDQSDKFDRDGGSVNFDHPSSLDFSLLEKQLEELKADKDIEIPIYDFATHTRHSETKKMRPRPLVIVDGTLILSIKKLVPLFDSSIFIDVPEDIRFERRLKRDVAERGRTPEGVKEQFYKQVAPMHNEFVGPSISNSSIIVKMNDFDQKVEEVSKFIKDNL